MILAPDCTNAAQPMVSKRTNSVAHIYTPYDARLQLLHRLEVGESHCLNRPATWLTMGDAEEHGHQQNHGCDQSERNGDADRAPPQPPPPRLALSAREEFLLE